MSSYIHTYSGRKFTYSDPRDILVEDIAHQLSNIARFAGATSKHYSVAQHSGLVADIVRDYLGGDTETVYAALFHDSHEMAMSDIPTPFQIWMRDEICGGVDYLEMAKIALDDRIMPAVGACWPLNESDKQIIKQADRMALVLEASQLFDNSAYSSWGSEYARRYGLPAIDLRIEPMVQSDAKADFMKRYHYLWQELHPKSLAI